MSDLPREEHRSLREQLGVYALGHGTPQERAAVRAHLDGCAECRAELAPLVGLAARLDAVDPDRLDETPTPPPGLGEAILARIAEERARPTPLVTRRRLATAGAAAAVAASAFGVGWLVRPVPPPPPLEAVAVEVLEQGVRATADVIPHTWGVEVRLSGQGFTAGEAHRVWVTDEAGAEVPAGGFIGVGPEQLDCNLNAFVLREDAVGFTVVDAAGDVVLTSRF
ncbi:anti-sigma factor family protein [Geodermatophilus marinus]|uniref:anti-sigma factor family protein n=1 Tax=Geodermatophilus sp. LHW52908 TaxID=2303986 RepID=UPI000E3DE77A|nr:anti-sigma factor [Geodermatophilus sp. LHW52908]RFU19349.1 anti-sigma factor [Geodermatophilus sp. LHW52908]